METNRLELQRLLEDILGSRNVYYQPPASMKIKYPAIVYDLAGIDTRHANNRIYNHMLKYEITMIDDDVDETVFMKILNLPNCKYDRSFVTENLNHNVFTLYH